VLFISSDLILCTCPKASGFTGSIGTNVQLRDAVRLQVDRELIRLPVYMLDTIQYNRISWIIIHRFYIFPIYRIGVFLVHFILFWCVTDLSSIILFPGL
jgi:hypothetical protein